ncbi:MAG: glucosamine-6-phosphate deaminase [Defluviitaleaceae bacterium]|nr:glucosamine-6-phosphate deaminase [Defluviitaleaceae bacterium]
MKFNNISVFVEEDYAALSRRAAQIIMAKVESAPRVVLGLATGSTPVGTYEELIRLHKVADTDFSNVTTFNLDEYFPIKKESDQSYAYFMKKNLFDFINIPENQTNIPNGEAADYKKECIDYEARIAAAGGIDLQLLGIGNNGHIGFNEPADEFIANTHYVKLDDSTIKANARFFESESDVPRYSLTMGIKTIMSARNILLLVSGAGKAEIIHKTISGPITPKTPASILQLHPSVTIVADKDAASLLK